MLGDLIAAGARLFGGHMADQAAKETNAANLASQKEFAQSGIQWRVADAKAAGIHPLYALGAQTPTYTPTTIVGDNMGRALADSGQDISRAVNSTRNVDQKVAAYEDTVRSLSLQRMGLENEILSSQLRKINQAGVPPAFPGSESVIDGQGDVTYVESPNGRKFIVSRPELASNMQTHYGEGAGDIAGAEAYAIDIWRNAQAREGVHRGQDTWYHTGGGF